MEQGFHVHAFIKCCLLCSVLYSSVWSCLDHAFSVKALKKGRHSVSSLNLLAFSLSLHTAYGGELLPSAHHLEIISSAEEGFHFKSYWPSQTSNFQLSQRMPLIPLFNHSVTSINPCFLQTLSVSVIRVKLGANVAFLWTCCVWGVTGRLCEVHLSCELIYPDSVHPRPLTGTSVSLQALTEGKCYEWAKRQEERISTFEMKSYENTEPVSSNI